MKNQFRNLASVLFACAVVAVDAQESDAAPEQASDSQTEQAAQNQDSEKRDPPEQQDETSDDVFNPSEDISEDYAVPYPTDI